MKYVLFLVVFVILIQPAFAQNTTDNIISSENTSIEQISADGAIKVQIDTNVPKTGSTLVINLRFIDTETGNNLSNVNYDLVALQNGELILSQLGLYTQNGIAQHITSTLSADNHVDIMVILQGIGENAPYSGPQGEVFEAKVVPEFGGISIIVLAIITSSTIVFYKTKSSMFRI